MPQNKEQTGDFGAFPFPGHEENLVEASFYWTLGAFEELCEDDIFKVWKELPSHTKAHLRRVIDIESLKVGEL